MGTNYQSIMDSELDSRDRASSDSSEVVPLTSENAFLEPGSEVVSLTDPLEASGLSLGSKPMEFDFEGARLEELPQGRNYGVYASMVFIISRIVGSGIFSTPGGIYRNVGGSPFLFFLAWLIATAISVLCMVVYLELGTMMPRSGGPKVFLETIYKKPKYLASTMIGLQSVVFGMTCSNALIFGQYFLSALGLGVDVAASDASRYTGLVLIAITTAIQSASVKTSVGVQNALGLVKLALLAVLVLTGLYVILLPNSVTGIDGQLKWDGFVAPVKPVTVASFTTAVLQAIFSFNGWESIYFITSEIRNPVRTLKIVGPLSLLVTLFTYLFINLAYLEAVSPEEIFGSGQLIGALLFEKVFGHVFGKRFLSIIVALSAAGNVYVVLYAVSRMSQEVFREGILPYSRFMASNWPGYGTPVPTLLLSFVISAVILVFTPPGDVFSYIINLETYTFQILMFAVVVGFFKLRKDHPDAPRPIKVPYIAPITAVGAISYVLVTPFFKDESSIIPGLPIYPVFAVLLLLSYVVYWLVKFVMLPRVGNYSLHVENEVLSDGLVVKRWSKIY